MERGETTPVMDYIPPPEGPMTNKTLTLDVDLPGEKVDGTFDSGAEATVLSRRVYLRMPEEVRPKLRPTTIELSDYHGGKKRAVGEIMLRITIPALNMIVDYPAVVDDCDDDLLICSGFMSHAKIIADFDKGTLTRGTVVAHAKTRLGRITRVGRVALQKDWIIPAKSRQLVPGRPINVMSDDKQTWMVEPSRRFCSDKAILVARTVCKTNQMERGTVPVELYNPDDEPVHLFKGTTLAILAPVEDVTSLDLTQCTDPEEAGRTKRCGKVTVKPQEDLPDELQEMVDRQEVLTPREKEKFMELIREYRDVFATKEEPLGRTDVVRHEIKTTGEPIKCRYRRTPMGLRDEVLKEEEKMKTMGVIEPSNSPWASPVVMVRKKDGSLRYCIDYRRLNEVTHKDSYPLPNMEDCIDSLGGAKYFSTVDLSAGYWQVQLDEDAKDKSSFYGVGGGLWRFTVMPFGLCNAPATFERLMEKVLEQLQWQICLCYLDDILIFSRTVTEHFARIRMVLDRMRDAGLRLKPKKCQFFKEQTLFLGHVVSRDGIRADPEKISKVTECREPEDVHEVRSLHGFLNYYRRFIPNFSSIARPIIDLTKKDVPFRWGVEQDEAFQRLKTLLTEAPLLAYPRETGEFILDTDASDVGIGAVLSQVQDGEERVIAYGSKSLEKAERNYCITRRELWAVVHFVEHYRHFLIGRHFRVRTDNAAVRYWKSLNMEASGQGARWMTKLTEYHFDITHRAGKDHGNADGLSREPFIRCAQCSVNHRGAKLTKRQKRVNQIKKTHEGIMPGVTTNPIETDADVHWREDAAGARPKEADGHSGKAITDSVSQRDGSCDEIDSLKTTAEGGNHSGADDTTATVRRWPGRGTHDEITEGAGREGAIEYSYPVSREGTVSVDARRQPMGVRGVTTRLRRPRGVNQTESQPCTWLGQGLPIDKEILRAEQLKDPACVDALCWLQTGSRPEKEEILRMGLDHKFLWGNMDALEAPDGVLQRKVQPKMCGPERIERFVPPALRKKIMTLCHSTVTTGHFYFWKTLKRIKRHFLWPGMSRDIQNFCKACHVCATMKTAGRHHRAPMRRYDVGIPMEELAIDLMGPFPESHNGNKYVLVVVDAFSKWMEAYPVPNIEARTIAETLVMQFVSRFGVPFSIKSDRGRQFECELFREMAVMLDIEHHMSTPFHPQGNSRVERMVKVVGNLVASFCHDQKEWDKDLPLLTLAYRSSVHEVTGYSPNYIMLGREVSLPLDVMMGNLPEAERKGVPEYVCELKERMQKCFAEVRNTLKIFGERQTRYYNLKGHGDELQPGQLVYAREKTRRKGVSPKLAPKWRGPFVVVKRFGTIYDVQTGPHKTKILHFDLLKKCHRDIKDVSAWMRRAVRQITGAENKGVATDVTNPSRDSVGSSPGLGHPRRKKASQSGGGAGNR